MAQDRTKGWGLFSFFARTGDSKKRETSSSSTSSYYSDVDSVGNPKNEEGSTTELSQNMEVDSVKDLHVRSMEERLIQNFEAFKEDIATQWKTTDRQLQEGIHKLERRVICCEGISKQRDATDRKLQKRIIKLESMVEACECFWDENFYRSGSSGSNVAMRRNICAACRPRAPPHDHFVRPLEMRNTCRVVFRRRDNGLDKFSKKDGKYIKCIQESKDLVLIAVREGIVQNKKDTEYIDQAKQGAGSVVMVEPFLSKNSEHVFGVFESGDEEFGEVSTGAVNEVEVDVKPRESENSPRSAGLKKDQMKQFLSKNSAGISNGELVSENEKQEIDVEQRTNEDVTEKEVSVVNDTKPRAVSLMRSNSKRRDGPRQYSRNDDSVETQGEQFKELHEIAQGKVELHVDIKPIAVCLMPNSKRRDELRHSRGDLSVESHGGGQFEELHEFAHGEVELDVDIKPVSQRSDSNRADQPGQYSKYDHLDSQVEQCQQLCEVLDKELQEIEAKPRSHSLRSDYKKWDKPRQDSTNDDRVDSQDERYRQFCEVLDKEAQEIDAKPRSHSLRSEKWDKPSQDSWNDNRVDFHDKQCGQLCEVSNINKPKSLSLSSDCKRCCPGQYPQNGIGEYNWDQCKNKLGSAAEKKQDINVKSSETSVSNCRRWNPPRQYSRNNDVERDHEELENQLCKIDEGTGVKPRECSAPLRPGHKKKDRPRPIIEELGECEEHGRIMKVKNEKS
jgi:hypothetical protein